MEPTKCPTCEELFVPRTSGGKGKGRPQIYCSARCRTVAGNRAWRDRNRPDRAMACAECGGPVTQARSGRPRRFCSDECKTRASNRRSRRARLPLADPAPERRRCAHCGDLFTPKRRTRIYCYGKFCAQAAYQNRKETGATGRMGIRTVQCDGCGTEFTAAHPSARWCSRACANRHWGNVRARQRGRLSTACYTDREIFERDNWMCHLCREPVDPTLPRTHEDGATIDHIVPIALGGLDEPGNVATAHWRCNREKRAKLLAP